MNAPLQPLADYVVVQVEEVKTKTASGFLLPEKSAEKPMAAKVLAVGPDVKAVKVGERIIYRGYDNTDIKIGDAEYTVVKEENIVATVKQDK